MFLNIARFAVPNANNLPSQGNLFLARARFINEYSKGRLHTFFTNTKIGELCGITVGFV